MATNPTQRQREKVVEFHQRIRAMDMEELEYEARRLGLDPDVIHGYELYVRVLARARVLQAESSWTLDMMGIT